MVRAPNQGLEIEENTCEIYKTRDVVNSTMSQIFNENADHKILSHHFVLKVLSSVFSCLF